MTPDFDQARRYYEEAIELARAGAEPQGMAVFVFNLAWLELVEQRYEAAEARLVRQLRDGANSPVNEAYIVRGLGVALAGRRANHVAARLIGAGDAVLEQSGLHQEAWETETRSAALARIEAAIGASEMNEALGQGQRIQIGEAVELALSLFPHEA